MFLTCLYSVSFLVISFLISFAWNVYLLDYPLILIPIVLFYFLITLLIENKIIEKCKVNKTIYNVVTLQIPAIITVLLALIFWLIDPMGYYTIVNVLLFSAKIIIIPILLLRILLEILYTKKVSFLIICGLTVGILVGILLSGKFIG